MPFEVVGVEGSLGKEFGELRFLEGLLSLFGRRLGATFSLVIIFVVEILLWLVGVVYVEVMERRWHIFCFIVRW
jgi:hypothetical protein